MMRRPRAGGAGGGSGDGPRGVAGGPKRIVIWYDLKTDVIRKMLLDRLPRERSGPEAVYLDLVEEAQLGDDFYRHATHHPPDREVVVE